MGCGADWTQDGFGSGYDGAASGGGWQPSGFVQVTLINAFGVYGQILHFTSWSWVYDMAMK